MPKSAKPLPALTDDQKAIIDRHWQDAPDVLLGRLWPTRNDLTLRHVEWKAARAYLATIGKKPSAAITTEVPEELTTEQQEFIKASYRDATGPTELARNLYDDPSLHPASKEARSVLAFIQRLDPTYRREDESAKVDYEPPSNITNLAGRLNRYGFP